MKSLTSRTHACACTCVCACMCAYNDEQRDELCVRPLATLPSDDVPLLWSTHDDLRLVDLLLAQLVVPCQLAHRHTVGSQALGEVGHHLLHQGAHGGHIDQLEVVNVQGAIRAVVLLHFSQDAQQGHVGLPSTLHTREGGRT